jgi:hypothetical protein
MRPVVRASHRSRDYASGFGPALNSSSGRSVSGERCCRGSFHPVNPQLQGIFHGREQGFPLFCYFLQFDLYRISLVPFARGDTLGLLPGARFRRHVGSLSVLVNIEGLPALTAFPMRVMPLRAVGGVPGEDCYSER